MEKVSVKSMFEKELTNILTNSKFRNIPVVERGFLSIDNLETNSILFLGINPSYTNSNSNNGLTFYNLDQQDNTYRQYFGKFENIFKETGLPWSHMDLLYFQETKQNAIDSIMKEQYGVPFIYEQLKVSKKILEQVKPKVLIVCNTKARQFLGYDKSNGTNEWINYDFEFDNKIGTHRLTTKDSNLKNTPVFFTSMLTGQRAIDKGSYQRLVWHIKFVLNAERNNNENQ